jgi:ADP-heptose:LPS heptosyltransferase
VPALRALRRGFPEHDVVLAAPAELGPLVELSGAVDRVWPATGIDALEPEDWVGPAPELAVNLHGKGPQSHRALLRLGPDRLLAFGCAEAHHDGPAWDDDEHERARWCRLVAETTGLPADADDLRLPAPDVEPVRTGAVVVHPGAAFEARRWPADRYAAVARWAAEAGHDVVVTSGPGERPLAERVRDLAGLPAESIDLGRTGVMDLAALVAAARLVVCGDTGVAHVASAFGTPSVVLFGPTPPSRWGPPTSGPHQVLWHGDGVGDPWADRVDPALLEIDVDEVVSAMAGLLPAAPPARGTTPASA